MLTYNSPQLIAVNRVLLRLLMPRHSPYALVRLNFLCCSLFWIVWVSLEHVWLLKISVKRLHTLVCFLCFESFSFHLEISLFGEIVVNYPFGKTLNSIDLVNLMSSVSVRFNSFLFLYSIFNEHKSALSGWSVWMDSNHRPHAYQACALTTWATNRYFTHSFGISSFHRAQLSLVGGDDGVRTHDPLLAGQVLSQLSYTPVSGYLFWRIKNDLQKLNNKSSVLAA